MPPSGLRKRGGEDEILLMPGNAVEIGSGPATVRGAEKSATDVLEPLEETPGRWTSRPRARRPARASPLSARGRGVPGAGEDPRVTAKAVTLEDP